MMLEQSRHLVLQSYFIYAIAALERIKYKASTNINSKLSPTFCQSQVRIRREKVGPTHNSATVSTDIDE